MNSIGIDIGTTTLSFVVVDSENKIQKSITIPNDSKIPTAHSWEHLQESSRILELVKEQLDILLAKYPNMNSIGLTGQMHGILYVDENGDAISPLYTWQDERGNLKNSNLGASQMAELEASAGLSLVEEVKQTVGVAVASGYGLVTHIWNLRNNNVPENSCKICTIADYIGMKLTNRKTPILHASNAASLGFFDVENGMFMESVLAESGVDKSILPAIEIEVKEIGCYQNTPVKIAIGDNQASFAGSSRVVVEELDEGGAVVAKKSEENVLMNIGTGSQISALVDEYVEISGIEIRPYMDGKYLLVGASLCGGRAYAILERFLREWTIISGSALIKEEKEAESQYENMLNAAWKAYEDRNHSYEKQSHSYGNRNDGYEKKKFLQVQTTFQGTRQNPDMTGSIYNITEDNFTPGNIILGFIEGILSELFQMYDTIKKATNIECKTLVASGNGIRKNPLMQQMAKDIFEMEIQIPYCVEEAAYGVAICSGENIV